MTPSQILASLPVIKSLSISATDLAEIVLELHMRGFVIVHASQVIMSGHADIIAAGSTMSPRAEETINQAFKLGD